MEITIEGIIVNNPDNIESCSILVNDENYKKVRQKLVYEREKLIDYLKELEKAGLIKSIYRPKNKQMKDHLNKIVQIKKKVLYSIKKLDTIFI